MTYSNKACWVRDNQCINHHNGTEIVPNVLCQLNVYVTWTGTDVNGYYFKSAASRFSRLGVAQLESYTRIESETAAVVNI